MSTLYLKNVGAASQEPVDNNNPLPVTLSSSGGSAPSPPLPTTTAVPLASASVAILGAGANRRLVAWCFKETNGAQAAIVLHNAASNTAPLTYIDLAPYETTEMDYTRGKAAAAGLYLEVLSGSVIGTVDTVVAP